jgi:GTP-binding protein Era
MQIVFSDTPGVLEPNYKLQESMLSFSRSALVDADVLLYVTDVAEKMNQNESFLQRVRELDIPILLIINKIDISDPKILDSLAAQWNEILPKAEIIPISAKTKFNTEYILRRIQELLPESEPFFAKDQLTDRPTRFFITEIIREKILEQYDKEVPYSVEVIVEEFKESEKQINIRALIYVERDSQKGIIIGKGGLALKRVGTESRREIEQFLQKKVYIELYVKVEKDWRSKDRSLKNFGYETK